MGHQRLATGIVGALLLQLLAGCGSAGTNGTPSAAPLSAAGIATARPHPTPSPSPTPAAATAKPSPTSATPAAPVVLTSALYPYRITVPAGPTSFVPARVAWDGVQTLGTASLTLDHARAPGVSLVYLAMTDTDLDVDAFAAHMEERMQAWHGCTNAGGRRPFDAGDLHGVGFGQRCAGEGLVRAVLVGHGHALFAFTYAGADAEAALGSLVDFLGRAEWTGG